MAHFLGWDLFPTDSRGQMSLWAQRMQTYIQFWGWNSLIFEFRLQVDGGGTDDNGKDGGPLHWWWWSWLEGWTVFLKNITCNVFIRQNLAGLQDHRSRANHWAYGDNRNILMSLTTALIDAFYQMAQLAIQNNRTLFNKVNMGHKNPPNKVDFYKLD